IGRVRPGGADRHARDPKPRGVVPCRSVLFCNRSMIDPMAGPDPPTVGRIRAVTSTDATTHRLDTNTELCGDGSQANSASLIGGADGGAARRMDCRPTDRLAALRTLPLGSRHAGQHALADDRALELGKHRLTGWCGGVEALLVQVKLDPERVQFGEEGDEVLQATAETIDRPSHHHVKPTASGITVEPIELRLLPKRIGKALDRGRLT